jgi:hypothetical protein
MRQWAGDDGKSERCFVMEQIGIEPSGGKIIPRESGQTSVWSRITRELEESVKETRHMAVVQTTGAVSHEMESWHDIDWQKAHQNVRRLQVRIVKAIAEGRWGKVKALQRLLTRSYSAKVLAVKRVTENKGKRTPGVDGEIWEGRTN